MPACSSCLTSALFSLESENRKALIPPHLFCSMETRQTITGDTHELLVSGRIDGAGANQLEEQILAAIRAGAKNIYVNLSQVTFLCSAGLRVLLQYWRQMKNSQCVLLATRP